MDQTAFARSISWVSTSATRRRIGDGDKATQQQGGGHSALLREIAQNDAAARRDDDAPCACCDSDSQGGLMLIDYEIAPADLISSFVAR